MFRYSDNNKVSKPRELQRKVVTAVRKVQYLNNHPNPKVTEPIVSYGYETVTEVVVSPEFELAVPTVVGAKEVDGRREHQIRRPKLDDRKEKVDELEQA